MLVETWILMLILICSIGWGIALSVYGIKADEKIENLHRENKHLSVECQRLHDEVKRLKTSQSIYKLMLEEKENGKGKN